MTEDRLEALLISLATMPLQPLSYVRRRAQRICLESQTTQLLCVECVVEIAEVVVLIDISAVFCLLSCIYLHIGYSVFRFTLQNRTLNTSASEYLRSKCAISRLNNQTFSAHAPLAPSS